MEGFIESEEQEKITSNYGEKEKLADGLRTVCRHEDISWVNHGFSGFSFIALVHVTETMQTLVSHISLKNWKKL